MTNTGNPNHPKKGSQIKVDPIKKLKDIKAIKKILANKPRDFALFTIGINTNLRASDLLRLTIPNDLIKGWQEIWAIIDYAHGR